MDRRTARWQTRYEHQIPWWRILDRKGRTCWVTDVYPVRIVYVRHGGRTSYDIVERARTVVHDCETLRRAFRVAANHIRVSLGSLA